MFKALPRQNAARFQRPPAACVRAPVLSVLHKLKLSQMSCGINGSFNPLHALIRPTTQPLCILINSKWFCENFIALHQKLCQLKLICIPTCSARAGILVTEPLFLSFHIKSHRLLLFIIVILLTAVIRCNWTTLWGDVSEILTTKVLFLWSTTLSEVIFFLIQYWWKYCPAGIYIIAYPQCSNPRGKRIDYIFLSSPALIKDLKDSPPREHYLSCFICMPHHPGSSKTGTPPPLLMKINWSSFL